MTMDVAVIREQRAFGRLALVPAWLWLGVGVYLLLLSNGSQLLNDPDTYWHIAVGNWMLDHNAMPRVDIYSFTKAGEPWISTSWLAQILYAGAYRLAGWSGPVVVAAASGAVTFALFAFMLGRCIPWTYAIVIALAALVLSADHLLARPHLLVMPVMLAWVHGLASANDKSEAPSIRLLPLIALWANLHGGFVLGLVLVPPFAIDAWWNAEKSRRRSLVVGWAVFGIAALAACCVTPYGWQSLLAPLKILNLGELLHLIDEWAPVNFGRFGAFEACLLGLIAAALYGGVKLSPPRIVLLLGLLHMALSHVRNVEIFALLMPLVVMTPVSSQLGLRAIARPVAAIPFMAACAAALAVVLCVSTWALSTVHGFSPPAIRPPAAAVDVLKDRNSRRVLNDFPFGGYLISRGLPVFIDGRSELYGESFAMEYYRALQLKDANQLFDLLKNYDIDAVLLAPAAARPAVSLLDHLDGWQRVYSDDNAVLHVRTAH
jgi:hypothetical protein